MHKKIPYIYYEQYHEEKSLTNPNNDVKKTKYTRI